MKTEHRNAVRHLVVVVSLAALLFIAYTDAMPGFRLSGVPGSVLIVILVMTIPVVATHPLGNGASKRIRFGQACAIALIYLLIVVSIYPRIGASYYLKYNIGHESGTFVTYIFSKYGRQGLMKTPADGDQARHTAEYIEYGGLRKPHGTKTWFSPDGQLIREETWTFGVRHGPGTIYFAPSGAIHVAGTHRHGKRHGMWEVYTESGKRYARGLFEGDVPVSETWAYYDVDGSVKSEGEYLGDEATFAPADLDSELAH